ncbi:MAG: molybdopterin dehydrogenase, partial [Nitrospiraceae bacterium]|nr:molybdopterin dehydrogenase [Nitrospiraceae bacterium]
NERGLAVPCSSTIYVRGSTGNTVLEPDEIVTEIQIPKPEKNTKQTFMKLSLRKFIDPPLVTVAAVVSLSGNTVKKCKIVLGAVAPEPWEASEAENYVEGKELTKDVAEKAAEEAVANAEPLTKNDYKVQMAKVLVKRALLSL